MKNCKVCNQEKPYEPTATKKLRGFVGHTCWDCYKAAQTARYQEATKSVRAARNQAKAAQQAACAEAKRLIQEARRLAQEAKRLAQEAKRLAKETQKSMPKTARTLAMLRWKKQHPDRNAASRMRYHAAQLQRVPAWADHEATKQVYTEAQKQGLTVDHVYPLRGKLVSGLHVANNLQLLTKTENSSKGNKLLA